VTDHTISYKLQSSDATILFRINAGQGFGTKQPCILIFAAIKCGSQRFLPLRSDRFDRSASVSV